MCTAKSSCEVGMHPSKHRQTDRQTDRQAQAGTHTHSLLHLCVYYLGLKVLPEHWQSKVRQED